MFPIRDDTPRSTTPYVNYFLIGLNLLIYLFQFSLGDHTRVALAFERQFGFIPSRIEGWLAGSVPFDAAIIPLFTSMFLHGGWLHVIFNMWGLYIFGDNVEDRLGHFRYLVFYLASGLGADLMHFLFNMDSHVPSVGASGAIAGVMGAYFILFPSARVQTWFFIFIVWLPAWLVLGYWFVLQFLAGAASALSSSKETGGIAVWAHVGGFLAGLGLIKLFPTRRSYEYYEG